MEKITHSLQEVRALDKTKKVKKKIVENTKEIKKIVGVILNNFY